MDVSIVGTENHLVTSNEQGAGGIAIAVHTAQSARELVVLEMRLVLFLVVFGTAGVRVYVARRVVVACVMLFLLLFMDDGLRRAWAVGSYGGLLIVVSCLLRSRHSAGMRVQSRVQDAAEEYSYMSAE